MKINKKSFLFAVLLSSIVQATESFDTSGTYSTNAPNSSSIPNNQTVNNGKIPTFIHTIQTKTDASTLFGFLESQMKADTIFYLDTFICSAEDPNNTPLDDIYGLFSVSTKNPIYTSTINDNTVNDYNGFYLYNLITIPTDEEMGMVVNYRFTHYTPEVISSMYAGGGSDDDVTCNESTEATIHIKGYFTKQTENSGHTMVSAETQYHLTKIDDIQIKLHMLPK